MEPKKVWVRLATLLSVPEPIVRSHQMSVYVGCVVASLLNVFGPMQGASIALALSTLVAVLLQANVLLTLRRVKAYPATVYLYGTFTMVTSILLLFAGIDRMLSWAHVGNFYVNGVPAGLSPVSTMYFSVTTLTTIGFGDIVPATDISRALVTIQILFGLYIAVYFIQGAIKSRDTNGSQHVR